MGFFNSMNVSASGLTAQRLRMDVISENIANVNTTRTLDGGPFRRKTVLFEEIRETPFTAMLRGASLRGAAESSGTGRGAGVKVSNIVHDNTPGPLVFDPSHPDANEDGFVRMPNVNIVEEMINMISATRSYEANITAINNTKAMLSRTLEIGRQ